MSILSIIGNTPLVELTRLNNNSKVRILDRGDSPFLPGDVKDVILFARINERLVKDKKTPAKAERLLLGLTRIALWTDSWLSASSFQETIRVLVEASTTRRIDCLDGLKENVIIGRLIPVGGQYRRMIHPLIKELDAQQKRGKKQ